MCAAPLNTIQHSAADDWTHMQDPRTTLIRGMSILRQSFSDCLDIVLINCDLEYVILNPNALFGALRHSSRDTTRLYQSTT